MTQKIVATLKIGEIVKNVDVVKSAKFAAALESLCKSDFHAKSVSECAEIIPSAIPDTATLESFVVMDGDKKIWWIESPVTFATLRGKMKISSENVADHTAIDLKPVYKSYVEPVKLAGEIPSKGKKTIEDDTSYLFTV
jgi:hypothetical protein